MKTSLQCKIAGVSARVAKRVPKSGTATPEELAAWSADPNPLIDVTVQLKGENEDARFEGSHAFKGLTAAESEAFVAGARATLEITIDDPPPKPKPAETSKKPKAKADPE